jgi:hypothetical protein
MDRRTRRATSSYRIPRRHRMVSRGRLGRPRAILPRHAIRRSSTRAPWASLYHREGMKRNLTTQLLFYTQSLLRLSAPPKGKKERPRSLDSRLFHSAFLPFGGKASSRLIVIGPTQLELPMLAKGAATTMFVFKVVPSDAI